jgi:OHCU decarboxylase
MTLAEVNELDQRGFVDALGWVFEHSPWVAERAWNQRPFRSPEDLHRSMIRELETATDDEILALLRAHPDLGTRAKLSNSSAGEQSGAGLDQLTPEEYETLLGLNREYRDKFGFPFLLAVKGSTKHDIVAALERRIHSTPGEEAKEALEQVRRIALFRLQDIIIDNGRG